MSNNIFGRSSQTVYGNNSYNNSSYNNSNNYRQSSNTQKLGSYRIRDYDSQKLYDPLSRLQQFKDFTPISISMREQTMHLSPIQLRTEDYYMLRNRNVEDKHRRYLDQMIDKKVFNPQLLSQDSMLNLNEVISFNQAIQKLSNASYSRYGNNTSPYGNYYNSNNSGGNANSNLGNNNNSNTFNRSGNSTYNSNPFTSNNSMTGSRNPFMGNNNTSSNNTSNNLFNNSNNNNNSNNMFASRSNPFASNNNTSGGNNNMFASRNSNNSNPFGNNNSNPFNSNSGNSGSNMFNNSNNNNNSNPFNNQTNNLFNNSNSNSNSNNNPFGGNNSRNLFNNSNNSNNNNNPFSNNNNNNNPFSSNNNNSSNMFSNRNNPFSNNNNNNSNNNNLFNNGNSNNNNLFNRGNNLFNNNNNNNGNNLFNNNNGNNNNNNGYNGLQQMAMLQMMHLMKQFGDRMLSTNPNPNNCNNNNDNTSTNPSQRIQARNAQWFRDPFDTEDYLNYGYKKRNKDQQKTVVIIRDGNNSNRNSNDRVYSQFRGNTDSIFRDANNIWDGTQGPKGPSMSINMSNKLNNLPKPHNDTISASQYNKFYNNPKYSEQQPMVMNSYKFSDQRGQGQSHSHDYQPVIKQTTSKFEMPRPHTNSYGDGYGQSHRQSGGMGGFRYFYRVGFGWAETLREEELGKFVFEGELVFDKQPSMLQLKQVILSDIKAKNQNDLHINKSSNLTIETPDPISKSQFKVQGMLVQNKICVRHDYSYIYDNFEGWDVTGLTIANKHGRIQWPGTIDVRTCNFEKQVQIMPNQVQIKGILDQYDIIVTFNSLPLEVQKQLPSQKRANKQMERIIKKVKSNSGVGEISLVLLDLKNKIYSFKVDRNVNKLNKQGNAQS